PIVSGRASWIFPVLLRNRDIPCRVLDEDTRAPFRPDSKPATCGAVVSNVRHCIGVDRRHLIHRCANSTARYGSRGAEGGSWGCRSLRVFREWISLKGGQRMQRPLE